MELVRGMPITEYCDQNKLTIRQRLELFIQVCQAIQHAHQKGIIHRDVKPTNVLVTVHDGRPVPKVIDFGVAKAINQRLTEHTIYTRLNEFIGTPLYMSPEQAGQSGLDIDTRSDIYSLGVLLYELLTGTTPFEKQRLQQAALDEMRRIIREEEPPKPSTKISSLGATAAAVSEHRQTDPAKLHATGPRRPGLDRHEGVGKRPHPPLRNRQRLRRRRATLPRRRTDRSPAAIERFIGFANSSVATRVQSLQPSRWG